MTALLVFVGLLSLSKMQQIRAAGPVTRLPRPMPLSCHEARASAGAALAQIAQAITDINEKNLLVATASEEQAQVARAVDYNLVSIRDLSIQTSAGANQTATASAELSRLAVNMNRLVMRFAT